MKNRRIGLLLLATLFAVMLATPGCEKFHNDFPTGPVPATPSPSDPLPAALIGTWTAQSAVVDGQPWDLTRVFRDRYHPTAAAVKLQLTSGGDFSYELLDTSRVSIWLLQGPSVLHGQHLTCTATNCSGYPHATGFNIIDDTWSLNEDQLVLPHIVDDDEDHLASVTFKKQ